VTEDDMKLMKREIMEGTGRRWKEGFKTVTEIS
jgi:hypothetical protein